MIRRALALAAAAASFAPSAALAQQPPADLTTMPPVPADYAPGRTEWGDPDLRATYTLDMINTGRISFARPDAFGDRFWLTEAEFAQRLEAAQRSDAAYSEESSRGTSGLEAWMRAEPFARRTSMLVSPVDGKLPALRPEAEELRKAGRSSWVTEGRTYDWIDDFDTWDRCITRGFPASMLPFRYNNGIRLFQAPGYVVVHFEMLGDRIIPLTRILDGQQSRPLGRQYPGGRNHQYKDRRRNHARCLSPRRFAAQRRHRRAVQQRHPGQRPGPRARTVHPHGAGRAGL